MDHAQTRIAIAAVVNGLRKTGVIDEAGLATIADEIESAAELAAPYSREDHRQMLLLARNVRSGTLGRMNEE